MTIPIALIADMWPITDILCLPWCFEVFATAGLNIFCQKMGKNNTNKRVATAQMIVGTFDTCFCTKNNNFINFF